MFCLKLSDSDMTVKHLAQVELAAADALSRYVARAARSEDHCSETKESHIQTLRGIKGHILAD
jgi:hypothetical protein